MIEKIQDQLLNGLGTDLELAYYNRNILFQLRSILPAINKTTSKNHIEFFNFMRVNSKRNVILYLSRIYDTPRDKNTRCLHKLINQLESSRMAKAPKMMVDILWEKFKIKHSKAFNHLGGFDIKSEEFLSKVRCYITSTKESDGAPLFHVKEWRDGFIAHNDYVKNEPSLTDIEIEELLIIAEAALFYISDFLGTGAAFHLNKPGGEFVEEIFTELLRD